MEAPLELLGHLRQACDGFRPGLHVLEEATQALQQTDPWQGSQQEVARELEQASQCLAAMEGT